MGAAVVVTTVVATEEATEGPMEGRLATGVVAATAVKGPGGATGVPPSAREAEVRATRSRLVAGGVVAAETASRRLAEQGVVQTEAPEGAPGTLFCGVEKEINFDLSESDKAVYW